MSSQASPSVSGSPLPKRKKIDLSQHSQTLFLDGSLSDVTIKAFGRIWKLHKNILSSCPYFKSLFTKDWKDSKQKVLQLQIPDPKVTFDALHACLQSIYAFEIEFNKDNVASMLAAASFLQLDDQIQNCYEFMIQSMETKSVIDYLGSAVTYGGGKALEKAAFEFLEISLTLIGFQNELSKIDAKLMAKVVSSFDLFCAEDGSLYSTMIVWLYTKVNGLTFDENVKSLEHSQIQVDRAFDYFENLEGSTPFLSTDAGKPYVDVFRHIRIRDLLITYKTISSLQKDKIFPIEWTEKVGLENWKRIEQATGKTNSLYQNENYFLENCVRGGASYSKFQLFSNIFENMLFGFELIAEKSGNKWIFKIKRTKGKIVTISDEKKEILVMVRVVKMNQYRKVLFTLSSDIKKTSLKVGEEFDVLQTEEKLSDCAVNVSINYMF